MLAVFFIFYFVTGSHWTWSLSIQLDLMASKHQDIFCLCFPSVVVTRACYCTQLLTWAAESWTQILLLEWKILNWLSHGLHSFLSVYWLLILPSMERNFGPKAHFLLHVSLGSHKSLQISEESKKNSGVASHTPGLLLSSMAQNNHNITKSIFTFATATIIVY